MSDGFVKGIITEGLLIVSDEMFKIPITLRTERTGNHATLSLSDDRGMMIMIPCNDPRIKQMLMEVSENE